MMNGEIDANTIARMASQAGIEPAEMQAQWQTVHEGFYSSGVGILESGGIDPDAFEEFAASNPQVQAKVIESGRALIMTNDTKGLRELASTFYEQADKFMPRETRAALTEAGFEYQETNDGLKVVIEGTPVSFNVAVKQEIIRFSQDKD